MVQLVGLLDYVMMLGSITPTHRFLAGEQVRAMVQLVVPLGYVMRLGGVAPVRRLPRPRLEFPSRIQT